MRLPTARSDTRLVSTIVLILAGAFPVSPATADAVLPATDEALVLFEAPFNRAGALAIHPFNSKVRYEAMGDTGVRKTTDGGLTWELKNSGLPNLFVSEIVIDPLDPQHLILGFNGDTSSQGPRPYETFDGGERWEPMLVCEHQDGAVNLTKCARLQRQSV